MREKEINSFKTKINKNCRERKWLRENLERERKQERMLVFTWWPPPI